MVKVRDNVLRRMASRKFSNNRMFIDPLNAYLPMKAPTGVVRQAIKGQLQYEQQKMFGLWSSRSGRFEMGIGHIPGLDYATAEEQLSFIKAALGEVTEATRQYNTRDGHSIWRIIEFGVNTQSYSIQPIGRIVNSKGIELAKQKPFLVFYSSSAGGAVFAKDVKKHPGFKAKHFFLTTAHQIYQQDLRVVTQAAFAGLHYINKLVHGKTTKPGPVGP